MNQTPFSYRSFDKPPTKIELESFRQQYPKIAGSKAFIYYVAFFITTTFLFSVLLFAGFALFDSIKTTKGREVILSAFVAIIVISLIATYAAAQKYYDKQVKKNYRLFSFASENQLNFNVKTPPTGEFGMLFGVGHDRRYSALFREKNDAFWFGNYQYSIGSGRSETTYAWGVIAIKLENNVPNMVLDAKSNNINFFGYSKSNLPEAINRSQTLELEGDFNNYFTLYAPKEYERDALYIFTPDFMSLLIDESRKYDVETVADTLYIYQDGWFPLDKKVELDRISELIKTIGKKTISRTDAYIDERAERKSGEIAEGGKRLKKSLVGSIVSVIITTIIAIVIFYLQSRD